MKAKKYFIMAVSMLFFSICNANDPSPLHNLMRPAKIFAGCSVGALIVGGLAWALLKEKPHDEDAPYKKPSPHQQFIKKGIYLASGVSSLIGAGLSWSLSRDAEYVGGMLNNSMAYAILGGLYNMNIIGTSPDKHEKIVRKIGHYRTALRCLSLLGAGVGVLCLKKALSGDDISSTIDSLDI